MPPTTADDGTLPEPGDIELDHALQHSTLNFPVVGIGASAGGLPALASFFEHVPMPSGMAFVVILHLSPKHESHAADILQRSTTMRVLQVNEPLAIVPDHVYVIPPTQQLAMNDGHLFLVDEARNKGRPAAIDTFFRTLAQVHRRHAVSIVLSGTGTDGSVGLTRIKEHGGLTLAQVPEEAGHDGMPRAAIATGNVDFVLPVAEMPRRLIELWANAREIRLPADVAVGPDMPAEPLDEERLAEKALRDIMAMLRARTHHDFRRYKRATVLRRLERRMQVNGLPRLDAYRDFLIGHPEETPALLQDMLISVTNFFRDREAFDTLEQHALPALLAELPAGQPLRAWVAGCATGEEAYSIALLLQAVSEAQAHAPQYQVFASDIDQRAIGVGRAGLYPDSIVADVPPSLLRQFFTREQDHYRVAKRIRERVLFADHNVLRDPPFSRLHLICCRNLLIYLDRQAQSAVLEMFSFALRPGGLLFLGSSESAEAAPDFFTIVDKKHRIYRVNSGAGALRLLPLSLETSAESALARHDTPAPKRRLPFAEMHQRALDTFAPPSVLIDAEHKILHLSEGVARFLEVQGGLPSHNLLDNVGPALRLELRTALFKARQTGQNVEVRGARVMRDGSELLVNLMVRPFHDPRDALNLLLVIFDEASEGDPQPHPLRPGEAGELIVNQLEADNKRLKQHLQDTVEHFETSTEELMSSNEELQAINEELRSATEELETSKEELQSTNEELVTVNYELAMKVEETSRINDDLQNLTYSADIATIFIDGGMRIKRYTPRATDLFSLIASDIGRSLLDITHRLDYEQMVEDATLAFQALRVVEREVTRNDGRHYISRVLPYRTADDKIEGAILTFIDVTLLRESERKVRDSEERLRLAAESTRDFAIITTDEVGVVTSWNAGAERIFGYREDEIVGQPIARLFTEEDRIRGVPEQEMRTARERGRAEDERWHRRKDGRVFFCSGVMTPLGDGRAKGFAKIARDLSVSKQAEAAMESKEEFLATMSHELKHDPLPMVSLFDAVRAEQIVWNLLGNALEFTMQGGRVSDSGKGIDPAFIDRVFDMFSQEAGPQRRREGGLGIGLALVRELATAHGGRVAVQSEGEGRGATFSVWLPLQSATPQPAAAEPPAVLKGLRLLVVDDVPDSLESFAALLGLAGASVVAVDRGAKALESLQQQRFDVLISNIGMPEMSGYDLIAEVRRREARGDRLLAVACSGYARTQDTQRAVAAGFDALVPKPAALADIERVVGELLGRSAV